MSKRMLEKLALPSVKEELPRLHASHGQMLPEEAETEYLKVVRLLMHPLTHNYYPVAQFVRLLVFHFSVC